jgi:Lhr-like helicase
MVGVKVYSNFNWSIICELFNNSRTDLQCRERYCNILDPFLEESKWNEADEYQLVRLVNEYGKKWSLISKEFDGKRTDNQCKRKYKTIINNEKKINEKISKFTTKF